MGWKFIYILLSDFLYPVRFSLFNMECFKKSQGKKGKAYWIEKITEEDINKLPLILLGLNYQKYYPRELPKTTFPKSFQDANPGMAFFTSMFSNKNLASGIKELDNKHDLINVPC